MSKQKLFVALALFLSICGVAQHRDTNWLGIETDPLTTFLGAKTISVVVEPNEIEHWSLFFNVVQADFPTWMDDFLNPKNDGRGFDSKINIGGGFAIDYFIREEREGMYLGLINLFFQNEVHLNNSSKTILTHNLIPRLGYRWYPFERINIYVNPFLGIRYEYIPQNSVQVEGVRYSAAGLQPFGTIHIGFHF